MLRQLVHYHMHARFGNNKVSARLIRLLRSDFFSKPAIFLDDGNLLTIQVLTGLSQVMQILLQHLKLGTQRGLDRRILPRSRQPAAQR